MADKLSTSLQESLLTLICMDDTKGGIAAGLIDVDLFEPPYDEIAGKAIAFRTKFKRAPGEAHIDDIFDDILSDPKNKKRKLYQQVLGSILQQARNINPEYVLSRVADFMDQQNVLASLYEAVEVFQRKGDDALADAKAIMHKALMFKPDGLQKGTYLSDKTKLHYLTSAARCDYVLGIEELDRRGIGLTKGEATGFTGKKGSGKSWACVHIGVVCWLQGAKVLHVSLEMGDRLVLPRYHRRLFAVAKHKEKYRRTSFDRDKLGRVVGFDSRLSIPKLSLEDPGIEKKIGQKIDKFGTRLDRIHFKSFPTKRLSIAGLTSYMNALESSDGFMPDVLVLDYPKLMKFSRKDDLRVALGEQMEELRGLCVERNVAGFFPFQANRAGESASLITAAQIGEDYSLSQTVDTHFTYNQTKAEKELGLARLYVEKVRSDRSDFTILLTQDYETGQFVRQSAYMPDDYFDMIKCGTEEEEE